MIKFTEGICENVQKSLAIAFSNAPDIRQSNPFFEERKRGRPSIEKLIRRDLWFLWERDYGIGELACILRMPEKPEIIPYKPGAPVRIKFVQRGT